MAKSEAELYQEGGLVRTVRDRDMESPSQREAILDVRADSSVLPVDIAAFSGVEDACLEALLSDAGGNAR